MKAQMFQLSSILTAATPFDGPVMLLPSVPLARAVSASITVAACRWHSTRLQTEQSLTMIKQ